MRALQMKQDTTSILVYNNIPLYNSSDIQIYLGKCLFDLYARTAVGVLGLSNGCHTLSLLITNYSLKSCRLAHTTWGIISRTTINRAIISGYPVSQIYRQRVTTSSFIRRCCGSTG